MKFNFLLLILLFVNTYYLSAQVNDKEKYSQKELKTFAKIYKYTLDNPFDIASSMKKCVKELNISEKRMHQILQAQFAGNTIKLSNEEIQELEKLKQMMNRDKEQYDRKIAKFIVANKMQPSKYMKIKKSNEGNNKFHTAVNKMSVQN